ncbi:hypothetical protein LCGC14_0545840 [marine sediment metagenome]|uniref:Uncharacterized protein n=1 Tax=marine sediment metagenome TaxID=412755 RepID=A0A0F9RW32_9ZZZZ
MQEEVKQVSRYNEAGMQIMRLHELWLKAELYANRGLLIKWKFILDSVWRELYSDVKRKEDVESKEFIKENNKLKKSISECKTLSSMYIALDERHQFLKSLQDSVGKGAMYMDADDDHFD